MLQTKFSEFTQGRILIKTELRLGLISATHVGLQGYHVLKPRELLSDAQTINNVVQPGKGVVDTNTIQVKPGIHCSRLVSNIGLSHDVLMRRATMCQSVGTIYGMPQKWVMGTVQASIFGLNRNYITTDGTPSPTIIERRLKELNVATEVKEARIGRYFNAIMAGGFYDNSTALLVSLLVMYYKALFFEKTTSSKHTIEIPYSKVCELVTDDDYDTMKKLVDWLQKGKAAIGCPDISDYLLKIAKEMSQWLVKTKQLFNVMTTQQKQFDESSYNFEYEVEVYDMYTYDDGHSKSGLSFGNHYGFRNLKYLKDPSAISTTSLDNRVLVSETYQIPISDMAIDSVAKRKGYLNCSGMTPKEITLLNKALSGNHRNTPFLVDQNLDLNLMTHEICAYHADTSNSQEGRCYTSDEVTQLLKKLVMNHRYYEDLHCAANYLQLWLCQPSAETVEAHWWTSVHRTLSLPKLGLKRAVFPFLLEGEAVSLSDDALTNYHNGTAYSEHAITRSLERVTAWYWGEYMYKINKGGSLELLKSLHYPDDTMLNAFEREPCLASAVLGTKVGVAIYSQTGTYLDAGLVSHYKGNLKFGSVGIQHLADYGYTVSDMNVCFNSIVPPGCISLVLGRGGSLFSNTPYSNIFELNPPSKARDGLRFELGYEFFDMWILGVINRWQGYDVHYKHPGSKHEHRSFAANNVSIAMPPVLPRSKDSSLIYKLESIRPRQNEFGDAFDTVQEYKLKFIWTRSNSIPVQKVDYWAPPCVEQISTTHIGRQFATVVTDVRHYQVAVYGKYNVSDSGFHFELTTSGVPIPTRAPVLTLPEEESGEPPTTDSGGTISRISPGAE
nr:capsid protein [Helianthus annus leaf-associated totivirus 5]